MPKFVGAIDVNGAFTLPTADGSADQVLQTNGSGTISWADQSGGGASVTISDSAPGSPSAGNLWFESDTGKTFIYYGDGSSNQWVEIGGASGIAGGSDHHVQFNNVGALGGSANFTFDGSAAVLKSTLTVGVDDTSHDVKFFGATSGKYMLWDESADSLIVKDTVDAVNYKVNGGQGSDGQVLTSTGSGVAWEDAGGGGLPDGLTFGDSTGLVIDPQDTASNPGSGHTYTSLTLKGQDTLSNYQGTNILFTGKSGGWMAFLGFQGANAYFHKTWQNFHYIQTGNWISLNDAFYVRSSDIRPGGDNTLDLGTSGVRFRDVYSAGGVTTTSDVNLKENIKDTTLGLDFVNDLRPVEYTWKDGTRKHQGFIAQEVKTVLDAKDSSSDQGMWGLNTFKFPKEEFVTIDEDHPDGCTVEERTEERQSLRYHEIIAPLVKAVQELTTRLEALESA